MPIDVDFYSQVELQLFLNRNWDRVMLVDDIDYESSLIASYRLGCRFVLWRYLRGLASLESV